MAADTRLTFKDWDLMPEDGKRHELIGGEHVITPAPFTRHQEVCGNLLLALAEGCKAAGGGEALSYVGVVLSDEDVVVPDVVFVSPARAAILTKKSIHGAPDLIVEILGEPTRERDLCAKRKLYAARGVREYWIADPELETVSVYRPAAGGSYERAAELSLKAGDTLSSPLLPGLALPLSDVFS